MESPEQTNRSSGLDAVRAACDGFRDGEDGTTGPTKRQLTGSDAGEENADGEKRGSPKTEDDGRLEIPAHHARRPPNGFLLFCKRHRDIVSAKNPNLENRGVTKLLGNWWRTLEEDERDKYKELARQNKEIFIANNPQFTWYKLPAPPLRTLVTRPSNRRPPKLEPTQMSGTGPITPGKLADESQLGGLTSLLSSSLSPPTTPLSSSPPAPAKSLAPVPPKKRFLSQARTKHRAEKSHGSREFNDGVSKRIPDKKNSNATKKKTKLKRSNSPKGKNKNKMKWNEYCTEESRTLKGINGRKSVSSWKSENDCTHQRLIDKIVDSSFDGQKPFQDFDIQRTLDYINTEHTYQKNPSRLWQDHNKKAEWLSEDRESGKTADNESNIIAPNLNNNTIVLLEPDQRGENVRSYSCNENYNLMVDDVDSSQRKNQHPKSIHNNRDRKKTSPPEDGYIPRGGNVIVTKSRKDCDNLKRTEEDQKKPLKIAQDDEFFDREQVGERHVLHNVDDIKKECEYDDDDDDDDGVDDDDDDDDGDDDGVDDDDDDDDDGGGKDDDVDGDNNDGNIDKKYYNKVDVFIDDNKDNVGHNVDEVDDVQVSVKKDNDKEKEKPERKKEIADRIELSKNCDSNFSDFQSILGKVSREIVNLMPEIENRDGECMALARFDLKPSSEIDSEDGSWSDKSDESLPDLPEGRRSKRSCKGQRYEQFIKESVSRKRSKNTGSGSSSSGSSAGDRHGSESRSKRKKIVQEENEKVIEEETYSKANPSKFPSKEREVGDKREDRDEECTAGRRSTRETGTPDPGPRLGVDPESRSKRAVDGVDGVGSSKKSHETKVSSRKKSMSKVEMIKEKREVHLGEFNLNEKIEELPLLSFESFLQKKRQRKKKLLGMKRDGAVKGKCGKKSGERVQAKVPSKCPESKYEPVGACTTSSPNLQTASKPDFADLTTLAETALTLLSLREPR